MATEFPAERASASALDAVLPSFDATIVCETSVAAPAAVTYAAIRDTNLLDPLVRGLFSVRELPARVSAWLRDLPWEGSPRSVTIADFLREGSGMTLVAERPGRELVIGSVGRFWQRDYGHRDVTADEFTGFPEPGYAKLAMGLQVRPLGDGRATLRYEARTATTDEEARRSFGRYWLLIRPGVWLVMRRALALIRKEAERRAASPG